MVACRTLFPALYLISLVGLKEFHKISQELNHVCFPVPGQSNRRKTREIPPGGCHGNGWVQPASLCDGVLKIRVYNIHCRISKLPSYMNYWYINSSWYTYYIPKNHNHIFLCHLNFYYIYASDFDQDFLQHFYTNSSVLGLNKSYSKCKAMLFLTTKKKWNLTLTFVNFFLAYRIVSQYYFNGVE